MAVQVSELERQLESLEDEASHLRVSVKTLEQQLAQQKAAGTCTGAGEGEGEEVVDPTKTRVKMDGQQGDAGWQVR